MSGIPGKNEIDWRGEFPKSLIHFILEQADEGIWWLDKNSIISAVNPMGAEIVGCLPEEMIGHSPIEFLTFSEAPLVDGKVVDKTGPYTMHRVQKKDGSVSIVVSRTVPLKGPEGTYNGAIIYIIDISKASRMIRSEKTEEQLEQVRAERRLLIGIIKRIPDPLFLLDRNGTILFANAAASIMTGKEPGELEGNRLQEAGFPCPPDDETASKLLLVFESGSPVREVAGCTGPGGTIAQTFIATPVPGPDGACSLALLVARDPVVTDEHDKKTPERGDETHLTRGTPGEILNQSIKDVYLSLTGILAQNPDSPVPDDDREILSSIAETRRVHVLLGDLLLSADPESGEDVVVEVSCLDILTKSENELSELIHETGTSVIAGTLPTLWTDPGFLKMIFSSLLGNAILSRGAEPLVIRVAARRTGSSWQFSIKDNGLGIDPLYADRVFEIPDGNVFPDARSAGRIRLAVCKKMIERQGGRIWVDSIPGQGSTFYFTIPLERYTARHQSVDIARP